MDFEVWIIQVVLQLTSKIYRSMLQLGNLNPCVMLVLARDAEILDHHIRLLSKGTVNFEGAFRVDFGHFEEVTYDMFRRTFPP